MHRDKTVARIVLVLFIVHGALAAPVAVRQSYPDVAASSEKRDLDDSPHPGPVVLMPASDSEVAPDKLDDSYFTTRSSPSGSNPYLTTPVSGARQLHDDPPPESGILHMRNDPPGTSGAPPSLNDPPPASGDAQLHNDPPAGSGATQGHDDPPLTSGPPSTPHDDSLSESGDSRLHNDPTTSTPLETPQVHDDLSSSSSEFSEENMNLGLNHVDSLNHVHSTSGSDVPWDDTHTVLGVQSPPQGWPFTQPANSGSEAGGLFNYVKKKELLVYGGIVTALAIPWGVSYGVHKWIGSHGHKPTSRDLASIDVVGRGASMHP